MARMKEGVVVAPLTPEQIAARDRDRRRDELVDALEYVAHYLVDGIDAARAANETTLTKQMEALASVIQEKMDVMS